MLSDSQRQLTLLACFLVAPALSLAATIDVNGGTIGTGGSSYGNFSFAVDGGLIDVSGDYSASVAGSGPGTTIHVDATATYVGGTALASDYSFTIDDIQYYTLATLPGTASYDENAAFGGGIAAGSELVADLTYGSNVLPPLSFTTNGYQSSPTESLSGLSSPLEAQGELTFDFKAGTTTGGFITSTPEPGGVIPVAAILVLGLGIPAIRRSQVFSKNLG